MDVEDKIIKFLETDGPTLPTRVAKHIGTDIIIASAHLSNLVKRTKIKLTKLKVGSSPLYYLAGQEEGLLEYAKENLDPQDYKVLLKIKEEQVLREKKLDLISKTALRKLSDFVVPIQVSINGVPELFWRWYALTKEETSKRVAEIIEIDNPKPVQDVKPIVEEKKPEIKKEIVSEKAKEETKIELESVKEKIEPTLKVEPKQEKLTKEEGTVLDNIKEIVENNKIDKFIQKIAEFFQELKIKVEKVEIIRKNSEVDFIIYVPTGVGNIKCYCKAKNKAKCNDKDIASAYMEAKIQKLPLLFIYSKEMAKNIEKFSDSDEFDNLLIKKID
jgi:hypothetical protein